MIEKLRKKLFITGGKGFLGSAIIERLLVAGYELRLLVRPDGEKTTGYGYLPENHSSVKDNAQYFGNIEIYEGDITSPFLGLGQCVYDRLAVEIDEVFHCAAATHFESSGAGELNTINVHGTENVLRFAHEGRIKRFHYISTAYVAGKQNCTVYEDELTNEPTFNNEYEKTKFLAEKMVIEYSRSNRVPYTIYRPGIIVGDSTTGFTCKFENVYTFIKVMLNIRNGGPHKQRGMDDVPGGIV
ncbi:MAG: NAD-dependent epimerase/dehydratase family protein, partial [Planctomycetes bacterium]|nr:NAD-dependent epimerase/dehydratase family protein [Planctomycetota bacterium]